MKFFIETERLILRDFHATDAEAFFEMDSNPEVHRFLGNNPIKSIEQVRDSIEFILRQYTENGIGRWATIEKATGQLIGWSGLKFIREINNNRIDYYDVGYRLIPKIWGKGYATESCKAALKYGFNTMHLQEIIGTANEENKASIRVLEKCGLKFVEKFIWNDINCDWMKISKEEWQMHQQ